MRVVLPKTVSKVFVKRPKHGSGRCGGCDAEPHFEFVVFRVNEYCSETGFLVHLSLLGRVHVPTSVLAGFSLVEIHEKIANVHEPAAHVGTFGESSQTLCQTTN